MLLYLIVIGNVLLVACVAGVKMGAGGKEGDWEKGRAPTILKFTLLFISVFARVREILIG